jgi:hypothetical protein
MLASLADLKSVVDRYDPNYLEDSGKAFKDIFEVFDRLICDDSYYSQVMRKLSALFKAGIYYDKSTEHNKIIEKVRSVNNKNFKSIFYANFGKKEQATLYDSLCSVLDVYKADTDFLEELLNQEKNVVKGNKI